MATKVTTENMNRFIIAIVLVGVTLILGIFINSTLHTAFVSSNSTTLSFVNETNAFANSTGYLVRGYNSSTSNLNLTAAWTPQGGVYNVSVPLSNLSLSQSGLLTNATALTYSNLSISYTLLYSFNTETAASNASLNMTTALSTGTAWISILVIVGFASLVLEFLTKGLAQGAEAAGTPYYA